LQHLYKKSKFFHIFILAFFQKCGCAKAIRKTLPAGTAAIQLTE